MSNVTGAFEQLLTRDDSVRAWLVARRHGFLNGPLQAISAAGRHGRLWMVLAGGLALIGRLSVRGALQLLATVAAAVIISDHVVKPLVNRKRPFLRHPETEVLGHRPHDSSFPSSHAASAFAGALTLAHLVPGGAGIWWIIAVAIAYSRVYLGDHYPLDVVGGALIGMFAALCAGWMFS